MKYVARVSSPLRKYLWISGYLEGRWIWSWSDADGDTEGGEGGWWRGGVKYHFCRRSIWMNP